MTLTLDFQGQIFDSHILGMGRPIDLEWKRCELDTMLDAMVFLLAHSAWQIDQFPTCWPMNGLFVHWSRGWGVLSFSERLVVWSPAMNAVSVVLSWVTMDPSAEACLWTVALHRNLLLLSSLINEFLNLGCQLETYPWPSVINGGSSGCNLDFAIINTCQGNIISSKKTEHGSVLSSTEAVGDNWACQTHGDSSKLVQFEMETSHVHSKYLIILIKQALFFNSKHSCQVLNEN